MKAKFNGKLLADDVGFLRRYNEDNLRDMAKKIGVSTATLCRIENEGMPDALTLFKLCSWLKQPMDRYFTSK